MELEYEAGAAEAAERRELERRREAHPSSGMYPHSQTRKRKEGEGRDRESGHQSVLYRAEFKRTGVGIAFDWPGSQQMYTCPVTRLEFLFSQLGDEHILAEDRRD